MANAKHGLRFWIVNTGTGLAWEQHDDVLSCVASCLNQDTTPGKRGARRKGRR